MFSGFLIAKARHAAQFEPTRIATGTDDLAVEQDQWQALDAFFVHGLGHDRVGGKNIVLMEWAEALHLNAVHFEPLQGHGEIDEIAVHLGPAHAGGTAHRRIKDLDGFHEDGMLEYRQ